MNDRKSINVTPGCTGENSTGNTYIPGVITYGSNTYIQV